MIQSVIMLGALTILVGYIEGLIMKEEVS